MSAHSLGADCKQAQQEMQHRHEKSGRGVNTRAGILLWAKREGQTTND